MCLLIKHTKTKINTLIIVTDDKLKCLRQKEINNKSKANTLCLQCTRHSYKHFTKAISHKVEKVLTFLGLIAISQDKFK